MFAATTAAAAATAVTTTTDAVVTFLVWDDETDKLLLKLWDVHVEVLVVVLHNAVECEVGIVFGTAERIGTKERNVPQPPLYGCV